MFLHLAEDHPLRQLQQVIYCRMNLDALSIYKHGGSTTLSVQRDTFRKVLVDWPLIEVHSISDWCGPFVRSCLFTKNLTIYHLTELAC